MWLLWLSFLAWLLTVLAPCVLPLLPVIIGGSVMDGKKSRPWIIIASFAVSVLIFTLAVKYLVEQFGLFPEDLTRISAWILIVVWIVFLFPIIWQWIMVKTWLEHATQKAQMKSWARGWIWSDILIGFVLGPIFNTCSPTFAVIIATILPASFAWGLLNIIVYILWLVIVLSAIAYGGRKVVSKLKWAANPRGWFRIVVALMLVLVWVALLNKWDKQVETWFIEKWYVIDTTQREIDQTEEYRK